MVIIMKMTTMILIQVIFQDLATIIIHTITMIIIMILTGVGTGDGLVIQDGILDIHIIVGITRITDTTAGVTADIGDTHLGMLIAGTMDTGMDTTMVLMMDTGMVAETTAMETIIQKTYLVALIMDTEVLQVVTVLLHKVEEIQDQIVGQLQ